HDKVSTTSNSSPWCGRTSTSRTGVDLPRSACATRRLTSDRENGICAEAREPAMSRKPDDCSEVRSSVTVASIEAPRLQAVERFSILHQRETRFRFECPADHGRHGGGAGADDPPA